MRLSNTKSGETGEINVLGKLTRIGLNISQPFWNDDEVDYEIRCGKGDTSVNIPLQVKSVQFTNNFKNAFIQGLKKKYLERNKLLCLAIYNPDNDWMWLFSGSETIISTYERQKEWNKKHRDYNALKGDEDIRIAIPSDGFSLISEYKIKIGDEDKVIQDIEKIASRKQITIISKESNNTISVNSVMKLVVLENNLNIQSNHTEYTIEGEIVNLISYSYNLFKDFIIQEGLVSEFYILFRELFINSVAHRSFDMDIPNKISLSKNKIQIINPGGLPKELTLENFKRNMYVVTRNPNLVQDLVKLGLMENWGSGMHRVSCLINELENWSLNFFIQENDFITEIERTNNIA